MITSEIKQKLVDIAVEYFMTNKNKIKDSISYEFLNELFNGKLYKSELDTAGILLVGSVIVHNIPCKDQETKTWVLRSYKRCFQGLGTFVRANKQEKFTKEFSNEKQQIDLASGRILPSLQFLNTNYDYLTAGYGGRDADLIDPDTKITFEVKSNYRKNGSISGLHKANCLIDCDGTHLVIYPILYDKFSEGRPDYKTVLYRFSAVIPEDVLVQTYAINDELLSIIKSGELIPEVEKRLAEENFCWSK